MLRMMTRRRKTMMMRRRTRNKSVPGSQLTPQKPARRPHCTLSFFTPNTHTFLHFTIVPLIHDIISRHDVRAFSSVLGSASRFLFTKRFACLRKERICLESGLCHLHGKKSSQNAGPVCLQLSGGNLLLSTVPDCVRHQQFIRSTTSFHLFHT
jgi:hypothetical protein